MYWSRGNETTDEFHHVIFDFVLDIDKASQNRWLSNIWQLALVLGAYEDELHLDKPARVWVSFYVGSTVSEAN